MPPLTAAPLNRVWILMTGRSRWTPVSATLITRWWSGGNTSDDSVGHWHVEYEYTVGGEHYTGTFVDMASLEEDYPRPGQSIEIRFNPSRPAQSYYPQQRTQTAFLVVCVVFVVIMTALVLYLSFEGVRPAR